MIGGIVHDAAAVAQRRREMFPPDRQDAATCDPRAGIAGQSPPGQHCSLCPKDVNELCPIPCLDYRKKVEAESGVIVTVP